MKLLFHAEVGACRRAWRNGIAAMLFAGAMSGCRSASPDARLAAHLVDVSRVTVDLPAERLREPLTLGAAVARADAASEEVAALVWGVNIAAKTKLAAWDLRDPELRLSYGQGSADTLRETVTTEEGPGIVPGTTRSESGTISDDDTGYSLALRLYPPNPWVQSRRADAGAARTYAAVAELLNAQWENEITVRRLFAQIHFLSAQLRVAHELAAAYGEAHQLAQERAQQGQAPIVDVMTASRRYLQAVTDRDEARRELELARQELAALLALPVSDVNIMVDDRDFAALSLDDVDKSALVDRAMEKRRDLAVLYWRTAAARADYEEARAARRPWFTHVQLSYSVADDSAERDFMSPAPYGLGGDRTHGRDTADGQAWQIQTGVTLPIFPGVNHDADVRLAELRKAELLENKARQRIRREIQDALEAVLAIENGQQRYHEETRPIIEEMESVLDSMETQAGIDPGEIARVREQILESRRLELEAALDHSLAIIRFEEVLGMRLR